MELKAGGNALFRDGDFRGASNAFRHAIKSADQVSSSANDAVEFKVACLCNLAYACIKLGSMEEAEEACYQVLHVRPANAKALFRRGQARLALGRPIEAARDFSEVCLLEPNNAEAIKMLRLAQGGKETLPAPAGISPQKSERGKSKATAVPTTPSSGEALQRETTRDSSSSDTKMVDAKPEKAKASGGDEQNHIESGGIPSAPPSGSSFMVSGWLDSAERRQGGHPRGNDSVGNIDVHGSKPGGSADNDRPLVAQPGGVEGTTVSVSRLVSQLSLAQKSASKEPQERSVASGTAAPAVQAEWSRLQAEEDVRVQESLRRWSTGGGSRAQGKTTKAGGVKGKLVNEKDGKLNDKKAAKKVKSKTVERGGSKDIKQTSDLWASLEEEENRVREAFRAKLGAGEKLSSKAKAKERRKNTKNKSKENKVVL